MADLFNGRSEVLHQRFALLLGKVLGLRRHLAFLDAVMDAHPALTIGVMFKIKRQRSEIKAALGCFFVVPLDGALFDLRRRTLRIRRSNREDAEEAEKTAHFFNPPSSAFIFASASAWAGSDARSLASWGSAWRS